MLRTLSLASLALIVLVGGGACKAEKAPVKQPDVKAVAPITPGAPEAIRRIAIEAGMEGYVPETIPGKPGEQLVLVFTRTAEGECLRELKTPDGKLLELPMNTPVEVAVTVPMSGKVAFACGMDMFKGVVVADPKS